MLDNLTLYYSGDFVLSSCSFVCFDYFVKILGEKVQELLSSIELDNETVPRYLPRSTRAFTKSHVTTDRVNTVSLTPWVIYVDVEFFKH